MIEEMLNEKIRDYRPTNAIEQETVLKELIQHFVLASMARNRFFNQAAFHGGTCLRVLYGTNRFSEDLDFLLQEPAADFQWSPHIEGIRRDCEAEGLHLDVTDRVRAHGAVRGAFLKTGSIGRILVLDLPFSRHPGRKIRIKLEIDTNPPAGSLYETRYITFPLAAAITTQTLESSFALKSHALLCRPYTKGRDWYDFLWYVAKRVVPEFGLLGNALDQQGPWADQKTHVTTDWYIAALRRRIEEIDWAAAKSDVSRFVLAREQEGVALWGRDLFGFQIGRLEEYMAA